MNGLNRRLNALEVGLPQSSEYVAQAKAFTKYLNALPPDDRIFCAGGIYKCVFRGGWDTLDDGQRERLARLIAPIDPDGSMLRELQNPPKIESRIPPDATAQEAMDIYHGLLREGRRS